MSGRSSCLVSCVCALLGFLSSPCPRDVNFHWDARFCFWLTRRSVFSLISFACKAFSLSYGLQCKQTRPTKSASGTTLPTDVECGKLIREQRGMRTRSSVHTV